MKPFKVKISKSIQDKIATALETQTRTEINVLYNGLVERYSDELLSFATEHFNRCGKGIVKIEIENNYKVTYLDHREFEHEFSEHTAQGTQMKGVLESYEPDCQFVAMVIDSKGASFLIHSKRHLKRT